MVLLICLFYASCWVASTVSEQTENSINCPMEYEAVNTHGHTDIITYSLRSAATADPCYVTPNKYAPHILAPMLGQRRANARPCARAARAHGAFGAARAEGPKGQGGHWDFSDGWPNGRVSKEETRLKLFLLYYCYA